MKRDKGYKCSFCGRNKEETMILIAGLEGHICENCVAQAQQIIDRFTLKYGLYFEPTAGQESSFKAGLRKTKTYLFGLNLTL